MKFTRRPDLDPQTRIHIVKRAWLNQGVYGQMTHIATYYQISRTFLYQLLLAANLQLEVLFSDEKLLFQKDHRHLAQLILLLRLEGKCSLLSIAGSLVFPGIYNSIISGQIRNIHISPVGLFGTNV
jgi:hypothetical protein